MRITISYAVDAGPFDLYGNTDGFTTPFLTNQTVYDLDVGFTPPANTYFVIVKSTGVCTNYVLVRGSLSSFTISTLAANYCDPQVTRVIDNVAYHNGGLRPLQVGDIVYADVTLTILYNSTGVVKEYNSLEDVAFNGFITLDANSVFISMRACVEL